jgi:hypothetical protein
LSKQAGKQSEIIKKLRAKEKSLEKELSTTKSNLDEKTKVESQPCGFFVGSLMYIIKFILLGM